MQKQQNIKNSKILLKFSKNNNIVQSDNILDFLNKYIELYINDKISNNLSKNTINYTRTYLERFYDYIADELTNNEHLTILDINKYFLSSYLNYLTEHSISKSSQKLHLIVINSFIYYIADSDTELYGKLRTNIAGIKIKTEQKEKVGFNQYEQKRLFAYIDKLDAGRTYLAQRNALMLKILIHTGLRISELINIKWSNITEHDDDSHGLIYVILVRGKGDKERFVYLSYPEASENIEFLKKKISTNDSYLFTTTQGNQCNRSNLFNIVKKILQKAGIEKSGLHIFRHTFARNLVGKNINLSTIKDLLGHSNISVTAQFYAKSDEKAKKNALFHKS